MKLTPIQLAILGVLSSASGLVLAQQSSDIKLDRVEVTGSSIKRVDAETTVPITAIKAAELRKQGITTIEQAMAFVAGNQSSQGTSQSVGASTGGAAFADLRGLGPNKTLVLLNGRRISNNAIDGSAPDLNMIPFAALERIEVLRDGASSLYGTDAIGGVINFITRKDMTGGTLTLGADEPQHAGGDAYNLNVGYGHGDLQRDQFNVFGFIDYQHQQEIKSTQRAFAATGYIPQQGLNKTSGISPIANYSQSDANGNYLGGTNPSAPNCQPPSSFSLNGNTCRFDYTQFVDLVPDSSRLSGLIKSTIAPNADTQINLEYFVTQTVVKTAIAPVPYGGLTVNPGTAFFPGVGATPRPTSFTLDPTQPISVNWRDAPNGQRRDKSTNTQQRLVAGLEGTAGAWDYNTALTYNENKVKYALTGGYSNGDLIAAGVANGTINPFGQQTAAGQQALDNASVTGTLLEAKGQVYQWDGHASRELGDWFGAGHPAQIAVGAELRHEAFFDRVPANEIAFANQVVASTGVDPATNNSGSRNVYALFTELNAPLTKHLELTAALRSDKYSDFGSSINPKISLRFQPAKDLLLRGSFTTGFRAPSLYELNAPQTYTNTANSYNDPVNCPGGVALAGQNPNNVCGTQFIALTGGNSHLKAETSKGLTLGFVSSPNDALNFGLDFWWIRMQHEIGALSQDDIFANPFKYASLFQRAPNGTLSISALTCPGLNCGYVVDTNDNLGGVNVNGVDLNLSYRLRTTRAGTFNLAFAGTYVTQYALQLEENGPWFQNDGIYFNGNPVFRWQHNLSLSWNRDAWSAGVVNHFKSSYTDQNNVAAPYNHNQVGCYSTWDLFGNWTATPALSLTAGVRNLFDQNPPFSNQSANFQVGYDPRYTDPAGRTFYLRGNYSF